MERKNAWSQYSAEELSRLEAVNEDYKACLDAGKTERECVRLTIERIEKEGYKNLKEVIRNGEKVQAGDKVYAVCMDKTIAMFHMGTKPLEEGMNILGAHIDSATDCCYNSKHDHSENIHLLPHSDHSSRN